MQISCCGCYSVRTGTIIIGILDIILSIVMLVLTFVLNVKSETILMNVDQAVVRIVIAIHVCMAIFIAILLLVGVFKRIPVMLLPWVVLSLILGVFLLISVIYAAIIFFVNNNIMSGVLLLVGSLISLADKWEKTRVDGTKKLKVTATPIIFGELVYQTTVKIPQEPIRIENNGSEMVIVLTDPVTKEVTLLPPVRKRKIESYPVSVTSNSKTSEIHGETSKVSSDFHERSEEAYHIKEELLDHWNQHETTIYYD